MKLPRDVSGSRLATLLGSFGYETTRQRGSHLRLSCTTMGRAHHLTVPLHRSLAVGTLARIVTDVAQYLEIDRDELVRQLFGSA